MSNFVDLTGQKFGKLKVIRRVENNKQGNAQFLCKCDCGKEIIVRSSNLIQKHTVSCGCLRAITKAKHNSYKTRLYKVYRGMISRCLEKTNKEYSNYGARGITVCNEWKNNFLVFRDWALNNGYDENAKYGECTIDRIDVNGNYEPSNCRWINLKSQAKNTTRTIKITYKGKTQCLKDWAKELKIDYQTLRKKLKKGYSFEKAIKYNLKEIEEVDE